MKIPKRSWPLLLTTFVSTFGGALTWTGLPVFAQKLTGDFRQSSMLFICSTLASLLTIFWGGKLSDFSHPRKILIGCAFFSGLSLVLLSLFPDQIDLKLLYTTSLLNSLLSSLSGPALGKWLGSLLRLDFEGDLERGFAFRSTSLMAAKLLGMSLGPILYLKFGTQTLMIDGSLSLLEAALLWLLTQNLISPQFSVSANFRWASFSKFFHEKKLLDLLLMSALFSLCTMPLTNASLLGLTARDNLQPHWISSFWLVGACLSLFSNSLIASGILAKVNSKMLFYFLLLVPSIGVLAMSLSHSSILYLLGFALIPLSNPFANNLISSKIFEAVQDHERGRYLALDNAMSDLTTLLSVSLFTWGSSFISPQKLLMAFLGAVILRAISFRRISQTSP